MGNQSENRLMQKLLEIARHRGVFFGDLFAWFDFQANLDGGFAVRLHRSHQPAEIFAVFSSLKVTYDPMMLHE